MLEDAPRPEAVLPALEPMLAGRPLVAHNAAFDRRVLRQAFTRIGLAWLERPVLCTAALARVLLPLQRERRLGALAEALGIEVSVAHRALPDAETCARVLCALYPRLCAHAGTVGEALAMLAPRRRRRASPRRRALTADALPQLDFSELPRDPGV
jgi:DNA polymerase-3 subunit epsilon